MKILLSSQLKEVKSMSSVTATNSLTKGSVELIKVDDVEKHNTRGCGI